MENVEFCTSEASRESHIALSQHLLSFLLLNYLARSANLPEGLYILLALISFFFKIVFHKMLS